jgi:hypothetical protein
MQHHPSRGWPATGRIRASLRAGEVTYRRRMADPCSVAASRGRRAAMAESDSAYDVSCRRGGEGRACGSCQVWWRLKQAPAMNTRIGQERKESKSLSWLVVQ